MASLLPSPTHAHTSIPAPFLLNPYVSMAAANPFTLYPDKPESAELLKKTENLKYYIPKIDDLIEIIEWGKLHIFTSLVASRMFDLTSVSRKGETIVSALTKKGSEKASYTMALAESGIDPRTLAPASFWENDLTPEQLGTLKEHYRKFGQAKRVEAVVIRALRTTKVHRKTYAAELCDKVSRHFPHINAERILNTAFSTQNIPVATNLLKIGASPDRCPSILPFAHFLYQDKKADEEKAVFAAKALPARFPAVSFDHTRVDTPSGALSQSMESLGATGLSEMFFRSQLAAIWGIDDWGSTIDHFPRPDTALFPSDIHAFFDLISDIGGYANNPIIITDKDLSNIEAKRKLSIEEPHRPIVITTGWKGHACVVVIERGPTETFLYIGNRAPLSPEIAPGVYKFRIDPSKVTKFLITRLILNQSDKWLESGTVTEGLAKEAGATSLELLAKLSHQRHPNCTWTSTAELACYILQRSAGNDHENSLLFMKKTRAKARREFLLRYLTMDRTINPHLHSPALVAAILAKSIVRLEENKGEVRCSYSECINFILTSGLSVDIMQLVYTLISKLHLSISVTESLRELATMLHTDISGVIQRLDPIYRPGEAVLRKLRSDQAKMDTTPLVFNSDFHVIDWLEDSSIPDSYKVAIVQELIPPLYAFSILSAPDITLTKEVKESLQIKTKEAGLPTTLPYIEKFGSQLSKIDYTNPKELQTYLEGLAQEERKYSTTTLNAETIIEINSFYCYLSFVLQDPHAGVPLAALLLQKTRKDLARLHDFYPKKRSFPEDILSKSRTQFEKNIDSLIAAPGWSSKNKISTVMNILRREPFDKLVQFALTVLQAIDSELNEYELAEQLLDALWKENPYIVQEIIISWLTSASAIEELYFSDVFPLLVDLLWKKDKHYMENILKEDQQNVALWPLDIQAIVQAYFIPDATTLNTNLPDNVPASLMAQDLDPDDRLILRLFFTELRIPPFHKRTRHDLEAEPIKPAHKPFRT